jgi:hypothetical protein
LDSLVSARPVRGRWLRLARPDPVVTDAVRSVTRGGMVVPCHDAIAFVA